ncbi:MAG TPA: protein-disulfide reductase DsbD [Nitrosospira sp.]|nr:protein-disulfide reductase DsbD [Nitrosospira sp.]
MRYFLLLLVLLTPNAFAEAGDKGSFGFLSELQKLGSSLDQTEQELLPPDQAFKMTVRVQDENTLVAQFTPAKDYYLYRDKVAFKPKETGEGTASATSIENISIPPGTPKSDVTFGQVEVFHKPFEARIALKRGTPAAEKLTLVATYQGCNEPIGVCYAPINKVVELTLPVAKAAAGAVANAVSSEAVAASPAFPAGRADKPDSTAELFQTSPSGRAIETESLKIERMFESGDFWMILTGFFGIGLLLSFTPCVFPMFPILSGIIANRGEHITRGRGFILSLAYVMGMAITYAIAGVAAGLSGAMLAAALQNAWVLGAFALIFVTLAFSMFGFYELQLPTFLQSKLTAEAGHLRGGHLTGVFGMGALSALIVGPCVAAPLAGALLYISQTRDVLLGGSALFVMALGMGVPLLLLGASAGALLPKAGPWMEAVKQFFGVLLLGVAIWLISPVIPAVVHMLLWSALLIVSAIYLHAVDPLKPDASGFRKFMKGIGMIALLVGVALLIGVLSGSRDILQPLSKIGIAGTNAEMDGTRAAQDQHLEFQRIKTVAELDQRIAQSRGKYVMVDFYADWCISCKEMERFTFTDPKVQARLKDVVLLQVDVTAGTPDDFALLKRFKLFGPPGILFIDRTGHDIPNIRLIGFQDTERFVNILNAVLI